VQQIVVTGKQIESRSIGTDGDPAVQAAALLTQPGVPPDRVCMLGGRNPFEEIQALKGKLNGKEGQAPAPNDARRVLRAKEPIPDQSGTTTRCHSPLTANHSQATS